jgi:hypothetical protein
MSLSGAVSAHDIAESASNRTASFPLPDQPAGQAGPPLNTNVTVVNTEPVELDSTPVSPVEARKHGFGTHTTKKGFSPDFNDEAIDEFEGEKQGGVKEREVW